MTPRVSICLPTLNAAPFLEPRIDSIRRQTLADWEVIAVDGFSTDGTWERLQAWAAEEPRVRVWREEPKGIYPAINACIERGGGPYVYIATADDTMAPDCLEKLAAALDAHPECGIAHCGLRVIDGQGQDAPESRQWRRFQTALYFGALMQTPHIRLAPHDGLLHYAVFTVYSSLTQLLIRRDVFTRFGVFDGSFGPSGDFEWGMRVSLLTNTVHVPFELATWRRHPAQATPRNVNHAAGRLLLLRMSRIAWRRARTLGASLDRRLQPLLERRYREEYIHFGVEERLSWYRRGAFLAWAALRMPADTARYVARRTLGRPVLQPYWPDWIRKQFEARGIPLPAKAAETVDCRP
jgi:glycosyltransferase involved in cell wall biosynthesis